MRSPADRRRLAERVARAVALGALAVLFWRVMRPATAIPASVGVTRTAGLAVALGDWTMRGPHGADLELDSLPGPVERDWLRALAATGTALRWRARSAIHPAAVTVEPLPSPGGRARLTTTAMGGSVLVTRDGAGTVDSGRVQSSGVRTVEATFDGAIASGLSGLSARTSVRDSVLLRPVLVFARAGWEGKFVVASLEEAGWNVEARFVVAPGVAVRQGVPGSIDTSRYAAVVALDETAVPSAGAITRYAQDGGGVVLSAPAASRGAFGPLLPARTGRALEGRMGGLLTAVPRSGLSAVALDPIGPEAVVVERRASTPVIVAAREALGRVVVLGYADTWRWRMMGSDDAVARHREWWSGLVASVARAPRIPIAMAAPIDETPYASLVAALGAPTPADLRPPGSGSDWWTLALFSLVLMSLLAEWTSRRTRGAR